MLYGTGTVFQLSTDGAVFHSLYSFGANTTDGNLYGTTNNGGLTTYANRGTAYVLATQLPLIKSVSPAFGRHDRQHQGRQSHRRHRHH